MSKVPIIGYDGPDEYYSVFGLQELFATPEAALLQRMDMCARSYDAQTFDELAGYIEFPAYAHVYRVDYAEDGFVAWEDVLHTGVIEYDEDDARTLHAKESDR